MVTTNKDWDGRCRCGHLHSEHNTKFKSHNYTAGRCLDATCDCKYFVHQPNESQPIPVNQDEIEESNGKFRVGGSEKNISVKPSLYAVYFFMLKEIALKYGYNLCIHGSMNRDLDLIAFPWGKETNPNHFDMVDEFRNHLGGEFNQANNEGDLCSLQPNGSLKYIINIWRRTPFSAEKDQEYYLDINIFLPTQHNAIFLLKELCQLKHYKDTVGKDSFYEKRQPELWKEANDFLNSSPSPIPVQEGLGEEIKRLEKLVEKAFKYGQGVHHMRYPEHAWTAFKEQNNFWPEPESPVHPEKKEK